MSDASSGARPVVLLLKGINVGGRRKVPMVELRTIATELGLEEPQTYIASGNLVARSDRAVTEVGEMLEHALAQRFGFDVPVIARSGETWSRYLTSMPFPEAASTEPNRVMLALSHAAPADDSVDALRGRASANERIERAGDALWIHFGDGAGRSAIAPGGLDRTFGGPTTTRNLTTVQALAEMAEAAGRG